MGVSNSLFGPHKFSLASSDLPVFLMTDGLSIGDKQLVITCVLPVHVGIVNLIVDAMTGRKPKSATRMITVPTPSFTLDVHRGGMPGAPNAIELS
jgi:hypothetical protein